MQIFAKDLTQKDAHLLLDSIVCPRPIFFVSTVNKDGVINLAPFSMSTIASTRPPMVCFSAGLRPNGKEKDTVANIRETKEFVVNMVTEEILDSVLRAAADYAPGISELPYTGLNTLASLKVAPPRVSESPVHMECRLRQIVELGLHQLVIGEVLVFHLDNEVYSGHDVDSSRLKIVGRMRGSSFVRTADVFSNEELWRLWDEEEKA
ncbi:MAG: flavin reductase family protein [Firmicutes bacterium]|nr:flavin reductase family protein [Bacillota bacterium]